MFWNLPCKVIILNDETNNINVYVSEDGKLHFVDKDGADTVLNFSSTKGFTCRIRINLGGFTSTGQSYGSSNSYVYLSYNNGELKIDDYTLSQSNTPSGYGKINGFEIQNFSLS